MFGLPILEEINIANSMKFSVMNLSNFGNFHYYDIPAVINYINSINKSGEKIIYVGHSQGTSSMFSGLTHKFDFYKKNIKLFVALAPVARMANLGSTLLSILANISIHKLVKKIKIY